MKCLGFHVVAGHVSGAVDNPTFNLIEIVETFSTAKPCFLFDIRIRFFYTVGFVRDCFAL